MLHKRPIDCLDRVRRRVDRDLISNEPTILVIGRSNGKKRRSLIIRSFSSLINMFGLIFEGT